MEQGKDTAGAWLLNLGGARTDTLVDGIVLVADFDETTCEFPEVVAVWEQAKRLEAQAIFFEAQRDGRPPVAQAFIFTTDGPANDPGFAETHKRLWSWGGVPIAYRVTPSEVQLFRCAHKPDFEGRRMAVFKPYDILRVGSDIATQQQAKAWWNADALRNGTLWDDPALCRELLSSKDAAQKKLINAVKALYKELEKKQLLPERLCRKLLVLSILIKYLEARKVLDPEFFRGYANSADTFFDVMSNGRALLKMLADLEERFNGHVFTLTKDEDAAVRSSKDLGVFARFLDERQDGRGQFRLWDRYSFDYLPVELISHIYQLFVADGTVAVYTPHFMVRLMVSEVLSWKRLDRITEKEEVILDGACGSGIFLVEAYKRLVLHWRFRNGWKTPGQRVLKKLLTTHIRGVDLDEGAVELAAFSMCLALCDALQPEEIRASVKLFPELMGKRIHHDCFFDACESVLAKDRIGVILGNPPFKSALTTEGAKRVYALRPVPDKQLAYLFLQESMELLTDGGILSMLQQYNLLYNQGPEEFCRAFFTRWDVREVLDFVSVEGIFEKGQTKVLTMVVEAKRPKKGRSVLHATFRRSGRTEAEQGFDIDHYDMHWLQHDLILSNRSVWRCNLVGGGRAIGLVERMREARTLGAYAEERGWDVGEGYAEGASGVSKRADHIVGKPLLPSDSLVGTTIDPKAIIVAPDKPIERPRTPKRFTPPLLLIREHMDLHHGVWEKYLVYKNKVVGFPAPQADLGRLKEVAGWLKTESVALKAYAAATSVRLFTQKETTLSDADIRALPYPEGRSLGLSPNERIVAEDIVEYYRELISKGESSKAMSEPAGRSLDTFNAVFEERINGIYKKKPLRRLNAAHLPGIICQPYVFGAGSVDWSGVQELREKLDNLLYDKRKDSGLNVTRVARVYDGACIYLLKPDRLRYWLRSVALRDADETLADMAGQGF